MLYACNNVRVHVVTTCSMRTCTVQSHQDLATYDVSQGQVVEDLSEKFDHL